MYEQTYKRLEKLKKTFDALVKRNEDLEEAFKIARVNKETYDLREAARERVLTGMRNELRDLKAKYFVPSVPDEEDLRLEEIERQIHEEMQDERKSLPPPT